MVMRSLQDGLMTGGAVGFAAEWGRERGKIRKISSIMCGISTVTHRLRVDGEPSSYCLDYVDELTLERSSSP